MTGYRNLRDEAISLMRAHGIVPSREMGQHFMVSERDLSSIVECASVRSEDAVLELGAGLGFLTREILSRGPKRLVAVEKDPRLVRVLGEMFAQEPRIDILEGDALDFLPAKKFAKIVSNPPFSISSRLVLGLLDSSFEVASITLQEEFAKRLTARPGSDSYGSLTVLTSLKLQVDIAKRIPRASFFPPPLVGVALVVTKPGAAEIPGQEWSLLKDILPAIFTNRKRKLKNSLMDFLVISRKWRARRAKSLVEKLKMAEERVYRVLPEEYLEVSKKLLSEEQAVGV